MESKYPFMSFYLDGSQVCAEFHSQWAEMSDIRKLEVLNTVMELVIEKTSSVVTSLEIQRTAQSGHRLVQ